LVIILGYQIIKRQSVRQMRRPWHSLKRGDIAAIVLAIAVVGFSLYTNFKYPNMHEPRALVLSGSVTRQGEGGHPFASENLPPIPPIKQRRQISYR